MTPIHRELSQREVAEILARHLGDSPETWQDHLQQGLDHQDPDIVACGTAEEPWYYEHRVYRYIRLVKDTVGPTHWVHADLDHERECPMVFLSLVKGSSLEPGSTQLSLTQAKDLVRELTDVVARLESMPLNDLLELYEKEGGNG